MFSGFIKKLGGTTNTKKTVNMSKDSNGRQDNRRKRETEFEKILEIEIKKLKQPPLWKIHKTIVSKVVKFLNFTYNLNGL